MKISVVVPVYNGEGTIASALESVFAQRFVGSFEVIVVNDGSTDNTHRVLASFGDRIHIVDQHRQGVAAARNAGIRAAAGEFVALLDADDTWTEDKLERMVPVLEQNPTVVAAFSDAVQVDTDDEIVLSYFVPPHQAHSPTLEDMLSDIWKCLPSASIVRRDTLIEIGGFPEEFKAEDWGGEDDIAFLMIRERGEIAFVPDKLTRYHPPDFTQRLAKRIHPSDCNNKTQLGFEDPARYFGGKRVFAKLIHERFGARGRKLADLAIETAAQELVSLGMVALQRGDRRFARLCYMSSISSRPLKWKTYTRLLWALLPRSMTRVLCLALSTRMVRSLSGPPLLEELPHRSGELIS